MSPRSRLVSVALLLSALIGIGCASRTHLHQRFAGPPAGEPIDAGDSAGLWVVNGRTHEVAKPFDEAVFSWDVRLASGSGARLESRVRSVGGGWSDWLTIAARGSTPGYQPLRDSPFARVAVDMIECRVPCDAIAWRVMGSGNDAPDVRDVWITTTASDTGDAHQRLGPEPIAHEVPHKAQREAGDELGGRLCSPTSVAMVLASRGVDVPLLEFAQRAHDTEFDLYGNWVNNTLAASELGVPMRVTRIGSWSEARRWLEQGPMVISLPPFHERELTGAGYSSRSGHLIVVAGLDDRGGVLVRDPAHADDSGRVYRRSQLTRLWLNENKGTAYVLTEDGR